MEILEQILQIFITIITAIGMLISGNIRPKQKLVMDIPAYEATHTVQGGCCDGRYIYIVMHNPDESTSSDEETGASDKESKQESKILKIDPETWTVVTVSQDIYIDHGNDMTYIPGTNEIYISNNIPHHNIITIVNPDTLEIKGTKEISENIFTIEYLTEENCYYCGLAGTYNFSRFNENFEVTDTYTGINNGYTRQGMTTDGESLYFLYYNTNCIYKYSKDGTYIGKLDLPVTENEPENIFWLNGNLYVCYNILGKANGGAIYKIKFANFEQ